MSVARYSSELYTKGRDWTRGLSIFSIAFVVFAFALLFGHWLGYERAVQQVEECSNARTPQAAMASCPDWLR